MTLVVEDPCLYARDPLREPAAVRDRNEDVLDAVEEQDGDSDLREVESPRADEGEVVVEPAVDPSAQRLGERLAEEVPQLREDRPVGSGEQRFEAAVLAAEHGRCLLLEQRAEDVFSVERRAELDDVSLAHAVE